MANKSVSLFKGLGWSITGQLLYYIVAFAVNIFFTKMLPPKDFGILGITMFFISISSIIVEGGMGGALIRKENVDKGDYSVVLVFNLAVSGIIYSILFFSASFISAFYKLPSLKDSILVLGLLFFVNSLTYNNEIALVREMKFKERSLYKITALIPAALFGLLLAYKGFGITSLIFFQLSNGIFYMLLLFMKVKIPRIVGFNRNKFKELFSFGFYTTLSSLFTVGFDNIYQLILGKYVSLSQVGFFYQGKRLQESLEQLFRPAIGSVMFSYQSKLRGKENFLKIFILLFKYQAVFLGLVCGTVYILAFDIIKLIYGSNWVDSVFYLQLLILSTYFLLQELSIRNIYKILDKTHEIFYLEIIKNICHALIIIVCIYNKRIDLLFYGLILNSMIGLMINFGRLKAFLDVLWKDLIIVFIIFLSSISISLLLNQLKYYIDNSLTNFLLLPVLFLMLYMLFLILIKVIRKAELLFLKKLLNS